MRLAYLGNNSFARHLSPWFEALADALEQAPEAKFYPRTPAGACIFEIERPRVRHAALVL